MGAKNDQNLYHPLMQQAPSLLKTLDDLPPHLSHSGASSANSCSPSGYRMGDAITTEFNGAQLINIHRQGNIYTAR